MYFFQLGGIYYVTFYSGTIPHIKILLYPIFLSLSPYPMVLAKATMSYIFNNTSIT